MKWGLMLNLDSRFQVNAPQIAHETIDNETIVIDFESGIYYSLREVANQVWIWLATGATVAEIVDWTVAHYTGDRAEIEQSVELFVTALLRESLIAKAEKSSTVAPPQSETKQPFVVPILEQYTDMQDLLLLDPIHEVDAQGWPARK